MVRSGLRTGIRLSLAALGIVCAMGPASANGTLNVLFAVDNIHNNINIFDATHTLVSTIHDGTNGTLEGLATASNCTVYVGGTSGKVDYFNASGVLQGSIHQFANEVTGIATDKSGNVYVATANSIHKLNSSGTIIATYTSTVPGILEMYGVAVDKNGTVWGVSQTQGGATVYKLNSSLGVIQTHFLAGGWATADSIAVDNNGNLVIADRDIGRIHTVNTTTWSDTNFGSTTGLSVAIDNYGVFGPLGALYVAQGSIRQVNESNGAILDTINTPGQNIDAMAFGKFQAPGVPEPGSVALMMSAGVLGTSVFIRRRKSKNSLQ